MTAHKDDAALSAEYGVDDAAVWGDAEPVPKPPRLDVTISVRFTADEIAAVRERAATAGMKPTAFIRQVVLDQEAPPVDRTALRKALSVIASEVASIEKAVVQETGASRPAERKPRSA